MSGGSTELTRSEGAGFAGSGPRSVDPIRVNRGWLDLREPVDAVARSRELVARLGDGPGLIHDLACGSGAMGRWLAPLLPGPQRWVLHDRDADLLTVAGLDVPRAARDGARVRVETRLSDVTELGKHDLAGATLVTASALLDLLTAVELASVIRASVGLGCPVLFTLTVTGGVLLDPPDPLDARVSAAFDAHQRRLTSRGRLLGPDALGAAVDGFRRTGAEVVVAASPWRLGPAEADLAVAWLAGWIGAACEHEPELSADTELYRRRRLREVRAGRLGVTVRHSDLLVLP